MKTPTYSTYSRPYQPWKVVSNSMSNYKNAVVRDILEAHREYMDVEVRWEAPSPGWVSLNTDGASKSNGGVAGCGGLCRDCTGTWLCGFSCNIGSCNAFLAEIWGVLEGLHLALAQGFTRVILQVDSAVVAGVLQGMEYEKRAWKTAVSKGAATDVEIH